MMWGASEGMGWWMLFGSIAWVVVVALVVFAFARVFEHNEQRSVPAQQPELPLEVARRRYAAGELSEAEFIRIRDNLSR